MTGPGVVPVRVPAIEVTADEYCSLRDQRVALNAQEKVAKKSLLGAMHAAQIKVYEYDGKVITVKPKDETETVVVKSKDVIEVGDGDGEGEGEQE